MSLAKTSLEIKPPAGPAVVGRGLPLQFIVKTRDPVTGAWSALDISAARWTFNLRLWESDDDTAPIAGDEVVTKGSQSSSGELDHYHANGTTVRDAVRWEIVQVDNDNADTTTITQLREVIRAWWTQPIIDAPIS